MSVAFTAKLDPGAYRTMLVTLAVFRLRFVAPVLAFFAFGALGAGRTSEALFLIASLVGMGVIIWLWASWQAHSPANASIYEAVSFECGEDALHFAGAGGEGAIPWHAVKKWRYLSGHYLLHISSGTFIAIPSTAVPEDERGPLESLLEEKIGKGPRKPLR